MDSSQIAYTTELANLVRVSWYLLIPIALLLGIVLYKLAFIAHGVSEFLTLARYELYPTLKDLRQVASNVEVLSAKAVHGAETIEKGLETAGRGVESVASGVKERAERFATGSVPSFIGGLIKSMIAKKFGK